MSDVYANLMSYTATASSEITSYEDDNLSLRSVRREWRSGTLPLTDATIILDLGSTKIPAALFIWDTNMLTSGSGNSIAASYSTNGTDYSALGTVTIIKNAASRRASLIPVAQLCRYIKLTYSAATTNSGVTYARIGRIVVMTTKITACYSKPFNFTRRFPNSPIELVNGRPAIVGTGENYCVFSLTSQDDFGDVDYQALFRRMVTGQCVLDAGATLGSFLVESDDWQMDSSISLPLEENNLRVREVV